MSKRKPTYQELAKRLATAEPIVEALKRSEVDAVVGKEKIAVLLLREVGEALQQSDAGFQAMFELSGVGMVQAVTPAFGFTKVNGEFCAMTGYSPDELLEKTYIGVTHPADTRRDMHGLARVLRGKAETWTIEKRLIRKDGSVLWVAVNGVAMRDDTGRAVKILALVRDLTAFKAAEKKVQEQTKRLRKLASELARIKKAAAGKAR